MMYNKTNIFNSEIANRFVDNLFSIRGAEYVSFEDNKCFFLNKNQVVLAKMSDLMSRDYTYVICPEEIEVVAIADGKRYTGYSIQAAIYICQHHIESTLFIRYAPFGIEEKYEFDTGNLMGIRLKHHRKVVNEGDFDVFEYAIANPDFEAWYYYIRDNIHF